MRKTLILAAALMVALPASLSAGPMIFYVSTNGNNAWSGELAAPNRQRTDGPFASISRARDAVRDWKAEGATNPVNVIIRKGTYHLSEPLRFTPENSSTQNAPVTYEAYPGEKPVISGARPLSAWKSYKGGIWSCSVPAKGEGAPIRHLFYQGKEQDLARFPNSNPMEPIRGWMFTQRSPFEKTFIQWICRPPDWVEYELEVPADGDYRLWVRYAGHKGTAMVNLNVDGGGPIRVQDLPTDDFQKFVWSPVVAKAHFTKGRHTLRFTALGHHDGFYPDAWVFSSDPNYSPETNTASEGKRMVRIEAEAFVRKWTREVSHTDKRDTLGIGYNPSPSTAGIIYLPIRKAWESAPEPEMVVFQPDNADWLVNVLPVKADAKAGEVRFGMKSLCGLSAGRRCYVRNVFEELDASGEWYLDKQTGTLYFWPPDGKQPADGDVTLPVLDRLVEFKGDQVTGKYVSNVRFKGLKFRETTAMELGGVEFPMAGAIRFSGATKCAMEDCELTDLAANAVLIDSSCKDLAIAGCNFARIGANGIVQPPADECAPKDFMTRHRIAGNDFSHCSQLHKGCAAVQLYYGGNVIEYNYIHDQPRWAVALPFIRGGHNIVRYNEMRRTCLETGDCGPIHVSRGPDKDVAGGEISYNLIVDSPGMITGQDGQIVSPYYCWGIYLDGLATGYHVHHNIVANNSSGGVFIHGGDGNIFENNIFLNSMDSQLVLGTYLNPDMKDNQVVRNIFYYTGKKSVAYYNMGGAKPKASNVINSNLFWHAGLPVEMIDNGGPLRGGDSWKAWQAMGFDVHSVVADPMFVDLSNGNYRLKPGSPALRLGFEQIDLSRVGLAGYRARLQTGRPLTPNEAAQLYDAADPETFRPSSTKANLPNAHVSLEQLLTAREAKSPWVRLFNGRDFTGFHIQLCGQGTNDPKHVFSIHDGVIHVQKDAIEDTEMPFGGLITDQDFGDYHLRCEFQWGKKKFAPKNNVPRDAGILYHVTGPDNFFGDTWGRSLECQIQEKDVGDLWTVGTRAYSFVTAAQTNVLVASLHSEHEGSVGGSSDFCRIAKASDAEREGWNTVEVIARGDAAVHIVNGTPVHYLFNARTPDPAKPDPAKPDKWIPLTRGRLWFQAEGAEVKYRNIEICSLPPLDQIASASPAPTNAPSASTKSPPP
jgi:hypothetical protein